MKGLIIALAILSFILTLLVQFDQLEPPCKHWEVERKRVYSAKVKRILEIDIPICKEK